MSLKEAINDTVEKVKEKLSPGDEGSEPDPGKDQMHPAVNKDEPAAFANPEESGAKKRSEDVRGEPMRTSAQIQQGSSESCAEDVHTRSGSDPHAVQDQMHPAVNKDEPAAFANPCESGAKKPSEEVTGEAMPESGRK